MLKYLILVLLTVFTTSCREEKPEEETRTYHVYLYNKDGKTLYSGVVKGLSSCRYIANKRIRGSQNPGWDFYCCWENEGNKCYEKHH